MEGAEGQRAERDGRPVVRHQEEDDHDRGAGDDQLVARVQIVRGGDDGAAREPGADARHQHRVQRARRQLAHAEERHVEVLGRVPEAEVLAILLADPLAPLEEIYGLEREHRGRHGRCERTPLKGGVKDMVEAPELPYHAAGTFKLGAEDHAEAREGRCEVHQRVGRAEHGDRHEAQLDQLRAGGRREGVIKRGEDSEGQLYGLGVPSSRQPSSRHASSAVPTWKAQLLNITEV